MAMTELRKEVEATSRAELNRANAKFPLFNSQHEGYAVILEELEESKEALDVVTSSMAVMWDRVRGKEIASFLEKETSPMAIYNQAVESACEMIQTAAMLLKYETSLGSNGEESGEDMDYV